MQLGIRVGVALICAATIVGCANVKVKKVSVKDRLSGNDAHVRGFRYYLNRPYVVVPQQVPIATSYVAVKPFYMASAAGQPQTAALVSLSPDPHTKKQIVFDPDGNELKDVDFASVYAGEPPPVAATPSGVTPPGVTPPGVTPPGGSPPGGAPANNGPIAPAPPPPPAPNGAKRSGTTGTAVTASINAPRVKNRDAKLDENVKTTLQAPGDSGNNPQQPLSNTNPLNQFGAGNASSQTPAATTVTTSKTVTDNPNATNNIQVVFLPDFEEQYAIRNKNVLAKTQYKYAFAHGTELDTAAGTYSAVDVPVKILDTIGNLINAAGALTTQRINNPPAKPATPALGGTGGADIQPMFYIKRLDYIEPGFYRLQKSWERAHAISQGQVAPEVAQGLFSDLGLVVQSSSSVISAAQYTKEHP